MYCNQEPLECYHQEFVSDEQAELYDSVLYLLFCTVQFKNWFQGEFPGCEAVVRPGTRL